MLRYPGLSHNICCKEDLRSRVEVKGEHSRQLGIVFPEHLATTARPSRRGKHDTEGNGLRAVIKQNKNKNKNQGGRKKKLLRGTGDRVGLDEQKPMVLRNRREAGVTWPLGELFHHFCFLSDFLGTCKVAVRFWQY